MALESKAYLMNTYKGVEQDNSLIFFVPKR